MNKERLVIKNFGPIKSIDLELGKMTILIGEQATGKSTVAKVLSVCRYFSYIADKFENNEDYFSIGLENWGIESLIKEETYIKYSCKDYILEGISTKGDFDGWVSKEINDMYFIKINLEPLSKGFTDLVNKYRDFRNESFTNIPLSFFQNEIPKVMENPFYIPTERGLQSIFSLGKSSIQNISDSLFNQFAKMDMFNRSFSKETELKPLNIVYKNVNGQGFVKNERQSDFSSLFNGASGYQSTIPIILAIKFYSENRKKKKTFIIEEPELNLFPRVQKKLMEFFVENINTNGHSFLLPTHSPYILSALTNCIYASNIAKLGGGKFKERVKEILPEKYWMNADDVSAYYLENGEAKKLVDKEEGLINIDDLDNVSEIVSNDFDKLLAIEVEYENNLEK